MPGLESLEAYILNFAFSYLRQRTDFITEHRFAIQEGILVSRVINKYNKYRSVRI
jgi:hypothetical protein